MGCICSKDLPSDHDHLLPVVIVNNNNNNAYHLILLMIIISNYQRINVGKREIQSPALQQMITHEMLFKGNHLRSLNYAISPFRYQFFVYDRDMKTLAHFPLMNAEYAIRNNQPPHSADPILCSQLHNGLVFTLDTSLLLIILDNGITGYESQTMALPSSRIGSFAATISKGFNKYLLSPLRKKLLQFIRSKLVARDAWYLPKSASDCSSNGSNYTREDYQLLLDSKTVSGMLRIQDTYLNTFLKHCLSYDTKSVLLRAALGVSELQEKHVWVGFEEKPLMEQEEILQYLYMNWQDLQQDSSVVEALKDTRFVTGADGCLYEPKHLFDPCTELLTLIFSGEVHKFPGERFVSDGWLNILRKTGLQSTIDADTVLECARKVELLGAESMNHAGLVDKYSRDFLATTTEISAEIWSMAETLIKAVFERFPLLYSHNFCSIFGKIECIPAEFGFPFESGKKRVLCSYSEAILLKDWPLAWTAAPILMTESLVPPDYSWGALQLSSPPPFSKVLKHLKAEGWNTTSSLLCIEESCYEVLSYLDTIWDTLSSSDVLDLQDISFIPVCNATQFVNCSSLFYNLTRDLRPLAFGLPLHYLPFVTILKELGLQDMLSISSAMLLLSSLQNSCRHHRLNPNELRAVIQILHYLYDEIAEHQNSDGSDWESLLVVPLDNCRLGRPHSCVYIDAYGSQYVKYIDTRKLRFVHPDLSERLCLAFGIRKLSDVVVEELDNAVHFQTFDGIRSKSLAAIRLKLLNRSFQVAVSSVLNSIFSRTSGSNAPDFQTLQRSLKYVAERLQFVQSIYTRFWLLPKSLDITCPSREMMIPEWECGSSHRALYYVDRSNTCMLISEPPKYVSVIDLVALVVSHVLGSPVPLPIGSLFLCPQDSETALVDILGLSLDERVIDGVGLGRDVLPQDAMQLHLTLLRPYHKGEIVAWQGQNEDKFKYGRIPEDVRPSAGQSLYRLTLETSPGKYETINSSRVFWFGNSSIGCRSSTHLMPQDGTCFEQSDGRVKLGNQRQAIIELEHDSVLDEEFAQAVEEMLCGAGIGLDTEMQCLVQTTLSLQEKIQESQAALLIEQEKLELARKEPLLCRICLTNVTDITIVPCGHVLCHGCLSSVSRCPFCRVQLSTTMKIYWS